MTCPWPNLSYIMYSCILIKQCLLLAQLAQVDPPVFCRRRPVSLPSVLEPVPDLMSSTILYRTVQSRTIMYKIVHSGTILYRTVHSSTTLYRTVQSSTIMYRTVHNSTILYRSVNDVHQLHTMWVFNVHDQDFVNTIYRRVRKYTQT